MAVEIDVLGYVVASEDEMFYRWFGYDAISPKSFMKALRAAQGEPLLVRINSYGGSTWAASEIYTELRKYEGGSVAEIVGLAASAAGVIALGCDVVRMSPTGEFMAHNPLMSADGDYREMEHAAEILRVCRDTIINAFELRCGDRMSRAEIGRMLNKETWFDARRAMEAGIIDEIMFCAAEPEKAEAGAAEEGATGATHGRAAAVNVPSAAMLRAQKGVWDIVAPGARSIAEARAALMQGGGLPQGAHTEEAAARTDEPRDRLMAQIAIRNAI